MEEFDARRSCRSQRHSDLYARRVKHRYLHLHAVLSVPEVRERQDQSCVVPSHTDSDGHCDLLTRVRDVALLPVLAWRRGRHRQGVVRPASRSLLASRLYDDVPRAKSGPVSD